MPRPDRPKIYHIVHVDRLGSIAAGGYLLSDAVMADSHRGLNVGECVPFYWCPRSVMLFLIHRDNDPDLAYHCQS
jgi:hypothetical protein